MSKIAIVTDSNSGITQKEGKELGISVISMPFYIDEELYFEDITLTQDEFYQKLSEDADIKTSQPAPGDVLNLWEKLLEDHDEIVHIAMSSGLSSSCATVVMLADDYDGKVQVVEHMNFRKAAEELNLTPSAVSHCVSGMEEELGFPLFIRKNNKISLTGDAKALLPYIKQLLLSENAVNQAIAEIQGFEKGTVKLGCFNSVCISWIPKLVKNFSGKYPGIKIELFQGTYDDIVEWLENGTIDLGFLSVSSAGKIPITPLYNDRLMCAVPKKFKTHNEGFITIDELKECDFVQPAENCDADSQMLFENSGFVAQSTCHVVDDMSILTMVQSGIGVCILPKMTVESYNANVDVYPIYPEAYRVIGISAFESTRKTPIVNKLYNMIVDLFTEQYT